jgi:hypothetical protein
MFTHNRLIAATIVGALVIAGPVAVASAAPTPSVHANVAAARGFHGYRDPGHGYGNPWDNHGQPYGDHGPGYGPPWGDGNGYGHDHGYGPPWGDGNGYGHDHGYGNPGDGHGYGAPGLGGSLGGNIHLPSGSAGLNFGATAGLPGLG